MQTEFPSPAHIILVRHRLGKVESKIPYSYASLILGILDACSDARFFQSSHIFACSAVLVSCKAILPEYLVVPEPKKLGIGDIGLRV